MGEIKHIPKERKIGQGFYDLSARLEVEECIHFHYNDMRLFLNKERFLELCELFKQAKDKYDQLGQPESTNDMHLLAGTKLSNSPIKGRLGIEIQEDNRSHVHYNDLRIHLSFGDLFLFFEVFEQAYKNLPSDLVKELKFDKCDFHPVVYDHLKTLESTPDYLSSSDWRSKIDNFQSSVGDYKTRNFGFPEEYPPSIPKEYEKFYLAELRDYIRDYGYAEGPFTGKYMVAYDLEEKPYIVNSHRLAVLMFLGYDRAKCYLVEKESNWQGDL